MIGPIHFPLPIVPAPLRFNQVAHVATHNAYFVKRDNVPEIQASGTEQRLMDQLLFEHVRSLELDLHKDDTTPKNWTIYHSYKQSNSLCTPLAECLASCGNFTMPSPSTCRFRPSSFKRRANMAFKGCNPIRRGFVFMTSKRGPAFGRSTNRAWVSRR